MIVNSGVRASEVGARMDGTMGRDTPKVIRGAVESIVSQVTQAAYAHACCFCLVLGMLSMGTSSQSPTVTQPSPAVPVSHSPCFYNKMPYRSSTSLEGPCVLAVSAPHSREAR